MAGVHVTELEEISECGVCTKAYTDPRILDCFHTFCKKCLTVETTVEVCKTCDSTKTLYASEIVCPLCKTKTETPKNGLEGLPVNEFMEKVIVRIAESKLEEERSDTCGSCESTKESIAYCKECSCSICSHCLKQHEILSILRSHHFVIYTECLDVLDKYFLELDDRMNTAAVFKNISSKLESCKKKLENEIELRNRISSLKSEQTEVITKIEKAKKNCFETITEYAEELKSEVRDSTNEYLDLQARFKTFETSMELLQKYNDVVTNAKFGTRQAVGSHLFNQAGSLEDVISGLCDEMKHTCIKTQLFGNVCTACPSFTASHGTIKDSKGFFRENLGFLLPPCGKRLESRKVEKSILHSGKDEMVDFAVECAHSALNRYGEYPSNGLTYSNISRMIADSFRSKYSQNKWICIVTSDCVMDVNTYSLTEISFAIDGIKVCLIKIDH